MPTLSRPASEEGLRILFHATDQARDDGNTNKWQVKFRRRAQSEITKGKNAVEGKCPKTVDAGRQVRSRVCDLDSAASRKCPKLFQAPKTVKTGFMAFKAVAKSDYPVLEVSDRVETGARTVREGVESALLPIGRNVKDVVKSEYPVLEIGDRAEAGVRSIKEHRPSREPSLEDKLVEAQKRTPRFLFRAWNNTSINPSGGCQDLNDQEAVRPLAYLQRAESDVESVFNQGQKALHSMLDNHLTTQKRSENAPTQFSSWASSLSVAVSFARGSNPYAAIVDTKMLRAQGKFIAHVPALEFLDPDFTTFHWEYLVHGVIEGQWYKAVSYHFSLSDIRFRSHPRWAAFPYAPESYCEDMYPPLPDRSPEEAKRDFEDAFALARRWGTHFTIPMFLGIMCQKFKHPDYRGDLDRSRAEVEKLVAFIDQKGLKVPLEWCLEDSIMVPGMVQTSWYEEVRAMLVVMRLLVLGRYPREVGEGWPGLEEEEILRGLVEDLN